ncbi:MAG: hypothetical protein AAGJ32_10225 [Pseudomonadota bacterium]
MDTKFKRWTTLGLGGAVATGLIAGCSGEPAEAPEEAAEAVAEAAVAEGAELGAVAGEGEGGEGEGEGEGGEGEGGVSIAAATSDAIVYNAALAITEAHIIAARDAYAAGETDAASAMFAHPVTEVLADMAPVFETLGVEDFSSKLSDASAAIFEGETAEQISGRADDIIATLRAAAEKSPDDGRSSGVVAAGVAVDQIERASDMYRVAAGTDSYEPYLDGYGFYKAGLTAFEGAEADIEAANAEAAGAIRTALTALEAAYPTVLRPESLDADQGELTAAASSAVLSISE